MTSRNFILFDNYTIVLEASSMVHRDDPIVDRKLAYHYPGNDAYTCTCRANSAILEAAEDNPGNTRLMHHVVVGLVCMLATLAQ